VTASFGRPGLFVQEDGGGVFPPSSLPAWDWVWADAAARTAQVVAANQVGGKGFQVDLQLGYELLGVGPTRWGPLPDPSMGALRNHSAIPNSVSGGLGLIALSISNGTAMARNQTNTNVLTRMARVGVVSSAVAGNVAIIRSPVQGGFAFAGGFRWRSQYGLAITSPAQWWFMGFDGVPAAAGADPATFTSCVGFGRSAGDANVQLIHNDGAGAAVKVDLGASFPALGTDQAHEIELYSFDGTSFSWQFTRLNTGAVISGTFNTDLPPVTPLAGCPIYYGGNNTDAVAIEICYGNQQFWQRAA
jgi:hypothetical protein